MGRSGSSRDVSIGPTPASSGRIDFSGRWLEGRPAGRPPGTRVRRGFGPDKMGLPARLAAGPTPSRSPPGRSHAHECLDPPPRHHRPGAGGTSGGDRPARGAHHPVRRRRGAGGDRGRPDRGEPGRGAIHPAQGRRPGRAARRLGPALGRPQGRGRRQLPGPGGLCVRGDPERPRAGDDPRSVRPRHGLRRRRAQGGRPLRLRLRPPPGNLEGGRDLAPVRGRPGDAPVPPGRAEGEGDARRRRRDLARPRRGAGRIGPGGGGRPQRHQCPARRGGHRRRGRRQPDGDDAGAGRPAARDPQGPGRVPGRDREPRAGRGQARPQALRRRGGGRRGDDQAFGRRGRQGLQEDVPERDRRLGPVLRAGPGRRGRPGAARGSQARLDPQPPRGVGRGDRPGPGLQAQALGPRGRADEPPALRIRLGGLGPARRDRGPGAHPEGAGHRPAADVPDRALDGGPRHLAPGRDLPRPVRRDRPERGVGELQLVRRGEPGGGRPDRPRGRPGPPRDLAQRHPGPGPEHGPRGGLRPPRRRRRQRPRRPGPDHAAKPRGLPPRLRLLRAARRRPLVGRRVRRLAPP